MSIPYKVQLNKDGSYTYLNLDGTPLEKNKTLPEVTVTAKKNSPSAIDIFKSDLAYNLNPQNYRFADLSDPRKQEELKRLGLAFGIPLAATLGIGTAPLFAPGTIGGSMIGGGAGSMVVGHGLESAQRAVGGESVGDMVSNGLHNLGVPYVISDMARPEYYFDPLHVGVLGKSMLSQTWNGVKNISSNVYKNTLIPLLASKGIGKSSHMRGFSPSTSFNRHIIYLQHPYYNSPETWNTMGFDAVIKSKLGLYGKSNLSLWESLGYNKSDRHIINNNPRIKASVMLNLPVARERSRRRLLNDDIYNKLKRFYSRRQPPYKNITLLEGSVKDNLSKLAKHIDTAKPGEVISANYWDFPAIDFGNYSQHSLPLIIKHGPRYGDLRPNEYAYIGRLNNAAKDGTYNAIYHAFNDYSGLRFDNRELAKKARDDFESALRNANFPLSHQFIPRIYHYPVSTDIFQSNRVLPSVEMYQVGFPYPEVVFKGNSNKRLLEKLTSTPEIQGPLDPLLPDDALYYN